MQGVDYELQQSLQDTNNSFSFQIKKWAGVLNAANKLVRATDWQASGTSAMCFYETGDGQQPVHPCRSKRIFFPASGSEFFWDESTMVVGNKISVTAVGAVIIRLWWRPAVRWDSSLSDATLQKCMALCAILRECC